MVFYLFVLFVTQTSVADVFTEERVERPIMSLEEEAQSGMVQEMCNFSNCTLAEQDTFSVRCSKGVDATFAGTWSGRGYSEAIARIIANHVVNENCQSARLVTEQGR